MTAMTAVIVPPAMTFVVVTALIFAVAMILGLTSALFFVSTFSATSQTTAHFLAAGGATFWLGETFFFEEDLLAGIKNKLIAAIFTIEQLIAGFEVRDG